MYHAMVNKKTGAAMWISDALLTKHKRRLMKAGHAQTGRTQERLPLVVAKPRTVSVWPEGIGNYSEFPKSSTPKPDLVVGLATKELPEKTNSTGPNNNNAVVVPFTRPATLAKGLPVLTYDGAGVLTCPVNDGWWWVKLDSDGWHIGRAEYLKPVEMVMEKAA